MNTLDAPAELIEELDFGCLEVMQDSLWNDLLCEMWCYEKYDEQIAKCLNF